jgi:hypothetical protein
MAAKLMRQLALTHKKLRNIPRRKRALARWAASFAGLVFAQQDGERYTHWKIPVHLNRVEGRQTTPALQAFCAQQLIVAAQHLIDAATIEPALSDYRVACLIIWPYLHQSEVTIFYDPEYYQGFINTTQTLPHCQLLEHLALDLPPHWQTIGVDVTQPDDDQAISWWVLSVI